MTSSKDTSPEEEGADANGAKWGDAKREEGAVESGCYDRNYASLCLTIA